MGKKWMQVKRITPEMLITIGLLLVFFSGGYLLFPPAVQMLALKAVQVSLGLLHAHAFGKLFFPAVDWSGEWTPAHTIRVVSYAIVPYCYALGG